MGMTVKRRHDMKMNLKKIPVRRAFTLLEIMLAIAIFGLVMAAIYSSWMLILRATKVGQEAAAQVQRQRVAVRTIEDALTCVQSFQASMQYYSFVVQNGDEPLLSFTARLPDDFPRNGGFGDFNLRRVDLFGRSRAGFGKGFGAPAEPDSHGHGPGRAGAPAGAGPRRERLYRRMLGHQPGEMGDQMGQHQSIPPHGALHARARRQQNDFGDTTPTLPAHARRGHSFGHGADVVQSQSARLDIQSSNPQSDLDENFRLTTTTRGIALFIVMIAIFVLSVMAAIFANSMKVETKLGAKCRSTNGAIALAGPFRRGTGALDPVAGNAVPNEPYESLNQSGPVAGGVANPTASDRHFAGQLSGRRRDRFGQDRTTSNAR